MATPTAPAQEADKAPDQNPPAGITAEPPKPAEQPASTTEATPAAASIEKPKAEEQTPDLVAQLRELAKDLPKEDFDRLFREDDRFAGHVGNLADRRFKEFQATQDRIAQQTRAQAQRDAEFERDPNAAWEREKAERAQLAQAQQYVAEVIKPFDNHLMDRYNGLPDEFKRDFGFVPSGDVVADRIGFMDAVSKAEVAVALKTQLAKAEKDFFEAGRAAERAERGKGQPVPDLGAGNQGSPPGSDAMTQEEFDQHRNEIGWIRQNMPRVRAGQRAGLITR